MQHVCEAAGGMSFVASCHHRVAQCFRMHGNAKHSEDAMVSLEEFQQAIRARHHAGVSASEFDPAAAGLGVDFS